MVFFGVSIGSKGVEGMTKAWLGWIGRGLFTAGALWFLANKLNWREFGQIVWGADGLWVATRKRVVLKE